jgi:hypothetical protein
MWLLLSRLVLRVLSFRVLANLFNMPLVRSSRRVSATSEFAKSEFAKNVRWAVRTAAAFLPGETVCFPKGIAAHVMCRLRGIPTTLVYGVGIAGDGRLKAHVWTQFGRRGVIGHALAGEYRVVAEFPVP